MSKLDRITELHQRDLMRQAAAQIDASIRQQCDTCKRGAVNMPQPNVEDLEALMVIRDGFDDLRKTFSPEMTDRFERFDRTINYLHVMIAGSK